MQDDTDRSQRQCNYSERLKAIRMSESERQLAYASLRSAERLCELFERAAGVGATLANSLVPLLRRWLSASQ